MRRNSQFTIPQNAVMDLIEVNENKLIMKCAKWWNSY